MNDRAYGESTRQGSVASPTFFDYRLRVGRWISGLLAAMLWLTLVYGLPLKSLRAARDRERAELTHLLKADKPDTTAIFGAFDYATEKIVFAATGPYLILAVATVFLIAHVVGIKRRLNAAERAIEGLRGSVLDVERISHE